MLGEYIRSRKLQIDYRVPELPWEPVQAAELLRELIEPLRNHKPVLIGSSLGGFYATWLAETYGLRAALVNPAVRPYELLRRYLGENANLHTDERYELRAEHVEQLRNLRVGLKNPQNLMFLVQTGDETLDYREAVERYPGCRSVIESGGSHGFDRFEAHLPEILAFLGLPAR